LHFKKSYILLILFLLGSFYLTSCINSDSGANLSSYGEVVKKKNTGGGILEEEIQYFFPTGNYYIERDDLYSVTDDEENVLDIRTSKEFEELDRYLLLKDIKYKTLVDQDGNIIDKTGSLNTLETVLVDGRIMFKIEGNEKKALVDSYDLMEEGYNIERANAFAAKLYCTVQNHSQKPYLRI